AVNALTAKTSATTAGNGIIDLGGTSATAVNVTSATGVLTITASGITTGGATNAIFAGPIEAGKAVTLTAAKGSISVASITNGANPTGTIALSAANEITTTGQLLASTSVSLKTIASTGTNGGISLGGAVEAFKAGKTPAGTVSITSTATGAGGISAGANDI